METSHFDYDLPKHAIAQTPTNPRDSSRLLVDSEIVQHKFVRDLPSLVRPGDTLVVNDTRVKQARVKLFKETGGAVEVLVLHETTEGGWWEALVRPSRKVPTGSHLFDSSGKSLIEVGEVYRDGIRLVKATTHSMEEVLTKYGRVPLPPYITTELPDAERYQTVFANRETSVAAPTAGLHLTQSILDKCQAAGANIASVDLSVGLGTFRPMETAMIGDHSMHEERYQINQVTWNACLKADRVIAIGTTVVRALESAAITGELIGTTNLFITPGFEFQVVKGLLTNFHLPRSTLLVMVEAFLGTRWRELYSIALKEEYRFLSFGDAMFLQGPSG